MNKQQLAAKIWESANKMRSTIEASQYKDYILGFIFYKFLSETEVGHLKVTGATDEDIRMLSEDDEETVKFVKNECGYFIAYNNLFQTWIAKGKDFEIADVRDALSAFDRNINANHKKVFDGIFETLQTGLSKLGSDARAQSKAARDLIYLIKDIPMDSKQDYDVLGYIYEYLIENFAANAGKKAGEFYTPHEVSKLMSEIVAWHLSRSQKKEIEIYDPTSGSASLLLNIGRAVTRRSGDPNSIKYYAQELKENTYNLTRMNLVMRGILADNIVVRNGDTLEDDWPLFDTLENKEQTYKPLFVDAVVSNPPYSQNWDPEDKETDPRFSYGIAPKSKADYAFLLHDLYHLRQEGIMCIVLPHGVLFRGGEEGNIRKNLVEHHHIQAIIGLPANIFFGTGIPTIVMVLRKQRDPQDNKVLIVDASKYFVKEGKNNKLQASDIKRIVDAVSSNASIEGFSRLVSLEEIRKNDYNLNIPRYVDASEAPESWDVFATMFGGIPRQDVDALASYWRAWPSLKGDLLRDTGEACLYLKSEHAVEDIAEVVAANSDVIRFEQSFTESLLPLCEKLTQQLVKTPELVDPLVEEDRVAQTIENLLAEIPLVDTYKAYQYLDDIWQDISIDLEILQTEGTTAIKKVDPNMVLKRKKNLDVEVQDGWIGRILPFDLVQKELMGADLAALQAKTERLSAIDQELLDLLENLSEEDKQATSAITEDGSAFISAELKRTVKAIGNKPADDLERALYEANKLMDEEKTLKTDIKTLTAELDEKTKTTIENLTDEQCEQMLVAKWVRPLYQKLLTLPTEVIDAFISKMQALARKYENTYASVCDQIQTAEDELSQMLDQLTGNTFDMQGIAELKKLLGGEYHDLHPSNSRS